MKNLKPIYLVSLLFFVILISSCKTENMAEDYYNEALVLIANKEYNMALNSLDNSLVFDEDYSMVYLQKAIIYRRLELYGKALNNINKFLEYDTLKAVGYTERGLQRVKLKDYDAAISDCDKALIYDEEYYKTYYCRGRALADENPDRALIDFSKSIELKNDYSRSYYYKALLHQQRDESIEACKNFTKAAQYGELRALVKIDESCNNPVIIEKQVVKVVEVEKVVEKHVTVEEEKPVEKVESVPSETKPSAPVYAKSDKIYEILFYSSNFEIQKDQLIDWGDHMASPEDLYMMVRELETDLFYLSFLSEGELVYSGKYKFSNIKDGFLYKRTEFDQIEYIRVNSPLEDCSTGQVAAGRTTLEILNYTRARGVRLVF